jgi:pyruvate dehydrogenase complex dehydrogenase (E1) component
MAFVRLLKDLLRSKDFGNRIVPIIPDEARTFGLDAFFPTAKIYNPNGQNYTSVDRELLLAYKESPQGQIMHVGINEAGAVAAFTGTGTAYSTHGEPLIPVYIFYSMFGFQRTGDAQWAAGDQMARGFIMGATAGRTTLTGEGLQHADGHSTCWHRRTRPRCRTTPRTGTRSPTSSAPAWSGCTAATTPTRTSCTTSRSTTSRWCSRRSPRAWMSRDRPRHPPHLGGLR